MNKFSYFYARFIPVFFVSILFIFQIGFTINYLSLEFMSLPIALVIALYFARKDLNFLNATILAAIFIISGIYSYYLFDKAGDGRWYHQETMIFLKYLWNPLQNYSELKTTNPFIFSKAYPIANEIIATSFYLLFKNIQVGKLINTIFAIYCMTISYIFFDQFSKINHSDKIIIALLISFNPIVCSQLFSYYLDANLYCYFVILLLSSYAYLQVNENKDFWLVNVVCSFWILANLKATGLIYGTLIITLINLACYLKNRVHFSYLLLITLVLGEIILGWHPYIQNLLVGHHLFWPIMGKNSMDILTILDVSYFSKVWYPIFSYLVPYPVNFEIPTWIPDIRIYVRTDARFGAYGPFFGILIIGGLVILYKNLKPKNLWKNELDYMVFLLGLVVIITILINPQWWFAKYVPQIFMVPILALIILIKNHDLFWTRYKKIILLMFAINSLLFFCGSFILTAYRSYLFFSMENKCREEQCILMQANSSFKMSLNEQLKDDGITMISGNCSEESIIWEDAKIGEDITNVVCRR